MKAPGSRARDGRVPLTAPRGSGTRQTGRTRRRGGARRRPPVALLLAASLAVVVALLPLLYLGIRALERGPAFAWDIVTGERVAALLLRSLGLAAVVVTASLVIGISLAWLTTRTALPGARLWAVLATLPLAVPSYVAGFTWISASDALAGFTGAALVLTLVSYPYVYLPVTAVLRRMDPAQEEAARSLGHGPVAVFRRVVLPQLRPAAAGGGLLVALYVLSDFGAVSIMRYETFTRAIHTSYKASFDRTPAAALSVVLVLLTVALVAGESRTRGRGVHFRTGGGAARTARRVPLGAWRWPALAWSAAVAAAGVAFPVGTLGYWLTVGNSRTWEPGLLLETTGNTVLVASLGAAATVLLALPVGVLAARHRTRGARLLEQAAYAGHAIPGITVALAMVFLAVRYAYPLYQELPLLVAAYTVLFLPVAVASTRAAVLQAPPVLEDVARSLGSGPFTALRRVTVPLATPGIAAGAALTFVVGMKELPATLLLRPTGMDTLATRLWTETATASYAAAAPYAAVLIAVAAVPSYLLGRHRP